VVIHLDTTFLVDLLRETTRERPGPAINRLGELADDELWLSVHVACELQVGAEASSRPALERERIAGVCSGMHIAVPDTAFPEVYGQLRASMLRRGGAIATMDLLIATAAVQARAPLLTRNVRDFSRVPGLEVVAY
jgi:predicted nucleic acid-binding protein